MGDEKPFKLALARNVAFKYKDLVEESGKSQIDTNPKLQDIALDLIASDLRKHRKNRNEPKMAEQVSDLIDVAAKIRVDSLTGLPNKDAFNEELLLQYANFLRSPSAHGYSVVMMDVDNYKMVNDTYGHIAGDELMAELGKIFKMSMRKEDFISRWGGDEFAMILPDGVEENFTVNSFKERLNKVNEIINKYMAEKGYEWPGAMEDNLNTHISIGICHVGDETRLLPNQATKMADDNARLDKIWRKMDRKN